MPPTTPRKLRRFIVVFCLSCIRSSSLKCRILGLTPASFAVVGVFFVCRFALMRVPPCPSGVVSLGFGLIQGRSGSSGDGRGHAADYNEKAAAVHWRLLLVMHTLVLLEVPTPWPDARCLVYPSRAPAGP